MKKTGGHPFFSVVIPTYNRENLILETLETVWKQTYKNYEIIVVDNASEDNTVELLKPYALEGKLTLIENPKNLERSKARNIGFKHAKGDYLTLLDSDDFMYANNLKMAAEFVQENPSIHFFHNYFELLNKDMKPIQHYHYPKINEQIKALAIGNFVSCIGVFISKEVYTSYFFNEDEKILGSEDWELWLRVRADYQLGVIPHINNGIRSHEQRSISAYDLDSIVERKNYLLDQVFKNERVKQTFGKYEKLMRASSKVFAAIMANQGRNFNKAKTLLFQAFKMFPALILTPRFIRASQIALFKIDRNKQ